MKGLAAVVFLALTVSIFGHPHQKIYDLLCVSKEDQAITDIKRCMDLEPADYKKKFDNCRDTHNATTDQTLCDKWDEIYHCAHLDYDHHTSEYEDVRKCIIKAHVEWLKRKQKEE
ncbi:uncharacterized protein LOC143257637 [Tachypleus tridentatus]|uniref:uncharacterized protein LOC143257637 n=1 Tax=Tachypleus tridentatus TaxID=6853 RepID=UPI003FD08CA9